MTDLFGVPMTAVMWVLVALLGLAIAAVLLIAVRNRILVTIGLRNIPRRPAQSILIVLGLMLSTAIIAAALSIGDTVNHSITHETYEKLGHVDEMLQWQDNRDETSLKREDAIPAGLLPPEVVQLIRDTAGGIDAVDGVLPGLRFPAPVRHRQTQATEREVTVIGVDGFALAGFEDDLVTLTGARVNPGEMPYNGALVNESLAKSLGVEFGDDLDIIIDGAGRTVFVRGVVKDRVLTGWTQGQPNGLVVTLDTAQLLFVGADTEAYGFVAVSNDGGVRGTIHLTDEVARPIEERFRGSPLEVNRIKEDRIERAEEHGENMAAIFLVLGLFTIASGMLLVFLILVMLAAERRSEMGMARAVGMSRMQLIESFMAEGMAYSVTAALIGAGLGVAVSLGMTRAMAYIFDSFDVSIEFHVTAPSLVTAYALGVLLTFGTATVSAWHVSRLSVVSAIRDLSEPARQATGKLSLVIGGALFAGGAAVTASGLLGDRAGIVGVGVSLAIIGIAFVARSAGRPERAVFTIASVLVLALWIVLAGETFRDLTGPLDAGIETFFIGGIVMVAAATFLVIYNAESLFGVVRAVGVVFARAMPAVRTAVAYPLSNRFRTGMTVAMLSLVVFALVMTATLSLNFRNLFLSDDARGGWDIVVEENVANRFANDNGNPLGVLGEALDRAFYDTSNIESIGELEVASANTTFIGQVREGQPLDLQSYSLYGADEVFIAENEIGLQARASGYASDRDVWQALLEDPNVAIIDGSVVPGINYADVTASRFTLEGYESGTRQFEPFGLMISDTFEGRTRPVRVIGIMNRAVSESFRGLFVSQESLERLSGSLSSRYYLRMKDGVDAEREAGVIEDTLADRGVSAVSLRDQVEEGQRLSSAFFYLVQGFLALGLGVGLAALGVIAFRTVVERRQQIGLMRAIGFSRANIALTFILESAFIAVLGIFNGTVLALLLASRILESEQFSTAGFTSFDIPWLQITIMAILVFAASVLTTLIPSRQASSIPIAEALRYE